jgi:hypothetical protein
VTRQTAISCNVATFENKCHTHGGEEVYFPRICIPSGERRTNIFSVTLFRNFRCKYHTEEAPVATKL